MSAPKPGSLADVAKLHRLKREALTRFSVADRAYDEALRALEAAVLAKDLARKELRFVETAYAEAKAEAGE
jgi:hypothetical protein